LAGYTPYINREEILQKKRKMFIIYTLENHARRLRK